MTGGLVALSAAMTAEKHTARAAAAMPARLMLPGYFDPRLIGWFFTNARTIRLLRSSNGVTTAAYNSRKHASVGQHLRKRL
jgi:hypothetical protein